MQNFTFQNTTRIHFGEGQLEKISRELPKDARVMMIFGGGSIKANGLYHKISKVLASRTWYEFSGIEVNPQYQTLMQVVKQVKAKKIDYLLAVGGGSVIDGAKFIAAAACYQGDDPWDILSKQQAVEKALPMGCVLTLPATGSETNTGAVVTRDKNKLGFLSPKVRPTFAILDPSVTLSLSKRQIGNGVVDAFVHTMEQYLTYPVNARVQDRFAEGLLMTLMEEGPVALIDRENIETRGNIMWSATMALNGLIGAGVPQDWTTHMIGHELTGLFNIDHARTLSIMLPAVMQFKKTEKQQKILQYAERVLNIHRGNSEKVIDEAIAKTKKFFNEMGLPTQLSEVDLGVDDIETILNSLESHGMTALGERRDIHIQQSRKILQLAL
jgi:NADP-dependent alcohol dehydrogenase